MKTRNPALYYPRVSLLFQSGARGGQEAREDVQREEEARQVRRHAGRGSQ